MLEWVATGLVLGGLAALVLATWVVRRLIAELPAGLSRRNWIAFLAFVGFFAAAYASYLVVFRGVHLHATNLIVPTVFFFGGCFVALVAGLMRGTARDVRRIAILEAESATDPLTGLANRRDFERRWSAERARARRAGLPLSMLMIDVDHFKRINDTLGHAVGDQMLVAVGRRIRGCLREADILARYGGEEFAVIAPHTRPEAAAQLGGRVRDAIARDAHPVLSGMPGDCRVTVSIGVAGCENAASGCEAMFERADEALYAAKRGGRNRVTVAPAALAASAA